MRLSSLNVVTCVGVVGAVALVGCSQTSASAPSDAPAATTTAHAVAAQSPEPTVSPSLTAYEREVVDYVEWSGEGDPEPGEYLADPEGEKGEKPDALLGFSAYFMDGAWYVFDGSGEIPQYVQDEYLDIPEDVMTGEAFRAQREFFDLNLCGVIMRDVNDKPAPNMFIIERGTGTPDPSFIAGPDGVAQTYSTREEAAEAYWAHYASEISDRCYNQDLLVLNSDNMEDISVSG